MKYIDFLFIELPKEGTKIEFFTGTRYYHMIIRLSEEEDNYHFITRYEKIPLQFYIWANVLVKRLWVTDEEYGKFENYKNQLPGEGLRALSKPELWIVLWMSLIGRTFTRKFSGMVMRRVLERAHTCSSPWMKGLSEAGVELDLGDTMSEFYKMSWKYVSVKDLTESNLETVFEGRMKEYLRREKNEEKGLKRGADNGIYVDDSGVGANNI